MELLYLLIPSSLHRANPLRHYNRYHEVVHPHLLPIDLSTIPFIQDCGETRLRLDRMFDHRLHIWPCLSMYSRPIVVGQGHQRWQVPQLQQPGVLRSGNHHRAGRCDTHSADPPTPYSSG